MIHDSDAELHQPDPTKPEWAETNYFGFFNAEEKLNIGVYALFRTNLGVVNSTITLNSRHVVAPWQAEYVDWHAALPFPESRSLLNYRLKNGLSVRCTKPNQNWDIAFDDGEGTSIDVTFEALMPPFDIHDPMMDPMAAGALKGQEDGKFAWGSAYASHFDMTGTVRGEVNLRGRRIPVDCVSTMDHSWGPRAERGNPTMAWMHAHFSRDLAVHVIFSFDPADPKGALTLKHGYVLEDGHVYGLRAGLGTTQRSIEFYPDRIQIQVEDSRGKSWTLLGRAMTAFPWQCYANTVGYNSLIKWQMNGLTGHGETMDFIEYAQLGRLNGNPATAKILQV
jgi:hypothetical protein